MFFILKVVAFNFKSETKRNLTEYWIMRLRKNNFRLSSLTVQITLLWFCSEITPVKCSGSF